MAKQGASYEDIIKEEGEEEQEEPKKGHGSSNTRLPFGLCARYGIPLPENARPRDAWNALKGKGIYPPWTEEGKDQYDDDNNITDDTDKMGEEPPNVEKGEKIHIGDRKAIYDRIYDAVSKDHSKKYSKNVNKLLETFDDNELAAYSTLSDNGFLKKYPGIGKGGSCYLPRTGQIVTLEKKHHEELCNELGFDWGATTFSHECGHALDDKMYQKYKGNSGESKDSSFIAVDDKCKEAAYQDGLLFAQKYKEITGEELTVTKTMPDRSYGSLYLNGGNKVGMGANPLNQLNSDAITQVLNTAMGKEFDLHKQQMEAITNEYEGLAEKAEQLHYAKLFGRDTSQFEGVTERISELAEQQSKLFESPEHKKYVAQKQRMGVLSDFIGSMFNGAYDVTNNDFAGHRRGYYANHDVGTETWAEFCAIKMTRDEKGIQLMKDWMPNIYKRYNEIYESLGADLTGGNV